METIKFPSPVGVLLLLINQETEEYEKDESFRPLSGSYYS